jgi:hypothetical protein
VWLLQAEQVKKEAEKAKQDAKDRMQAVSKQNEEKARLGERLLVVPCLLLHPMTCIGFCRENFLSG